MQNTDLIRKLCNKKVLVTGGYGFLGRNLSRQLEDYCKEVYLYDNDIRDIDRFNKEYDIVCHLAAVTKANSENSADILLNVNVDGTLAVMHYCYKTGARCIFASSSAVYNAASEMQLLRESSLIRPDSLYGISKMLGEGVCRYYAENFGVSVIALRIFNMYGKGQKTPFLIPYLFRRLSANNLPELKTPYSVKDFVHVADVTRAFVLSCGYEGKGFVPINIGTGRGVSVRDVTKKLAISLKSELKIKSVRPKGGMKADFVVADIKRAAKIINWRPRIAIDEGLALLSSGA